jgi:hypothetical protein
LKSTLLAIAVMAWTGAATALDLKGITLGTSKDAIAKRFTGLRCGDGTPAGVVIECVYVRTRRDQPNITELNTLADELIESWSLQFADGRLGMIIVTFPHASFRPVQAAMRAKYGPPYSTSSERFQNRMGATAIGQKDAWGEPGKELLTAREYLGDLRTSAVVFSASWFMKRAQEGDGLEAQKRAKDL